MILDLFKFEIKKQIKSVILWFCIIVTLIIAIKSCKQIFELPVISDIEAHNFINDNGGEENIYHIMKLWDYDFSKRVYDDVPKDQNPDNYPVKYNNVNANDINNIVKESTIGFRFSQLFFKILASQISFYSSFFLLFILPQTLSNSKERNVNNMIYATPISSKHYILSKFFGNILILLIFNFLLLITLGAYHMPKVIKAGLEFNLLDAIIPFLLFVLPQYLFVASFLLLSTVTLKHYILSIPLYIFLIALPNELGIINYFINPNMALTGSKDIHASIPPINLYFGILTSILLLILSFLFIWLSCNFWSKNRSQN